MYFNSFPKINYNFRGTPYGNLELLDIFRRVAFKFSPYTTTVRPTEIYIPSAGDTVDSIAHQFYGSSEYWWLVCLFNNITNPFNALPRTGKDYKFGQAYYKRNVVIHFERLGGIVYRDFKVGDLVIACSPTETYDTVSIPNTGDTYTDVPVPIVNTKGQPKHVGVIVSVSQELRTMTIAGDTKAFQKPNTRIITVSPYGNERSKWSKSFNFDSLGSNHITNWGKIIKSEPFEKRLVGFKNRQTGYPVSPMLVVSTGERRANEFKFQPINDTDRLRLPSEHKNYAGTIIGGYLGFDGEGSNAWETTYRTVFSDDLTEQGNLNLNPAVDGTIEGKLRLLSPEYKSEAEDLFKSSLNDERYSLYEFSNLMSGLRQSDVNYL